MHHFELVLGVHSSLVPVDVIRLFQNVADVSSQHLDFLEVKLFGHYPDHMVVALHQLGRALAVAEELSDQINFTYLRWVSVLRDVSGQYVVERLFLDQVLGVRFLVKDALMRLCGNLLFELGEFISVCG